MDWEAKPQVYVVHAWPLEITCNEEIQENILILCNSFPYM